MNGHIFSGQSELNDFVYMVVSSKNHRTANTIGIFIVLCNFVLLEYFIFSTVLNAEYLVLYE